MDVKRAQAELHAALVALESGYRESNGEGALTELLEDARFAVSKVRRAGGKLPETITKTPRNDVAGARLKVPVLHRPLSAQQSEPARTKSYTTRKPAEAGTSSSSTSSAATSKSGTHRPSTALVQARLQRQQNDFRFKEARNVFESAKYKLIRTDSRLFLEDAPVVLNRDPGLIQRQKQEHLDLRIVMQAAYEAMVRANSESYGDKVLLAQAREVLMKVQRWASS